jgi:hypothetical protein
MYLFLAGVVTGLVLGVLSRKLSESEPTSRRGDGLGQSRWQEPAGAGGDSRLTNLWHDRGDAAGALEKLFIQLLTVGAS